MDVKSGLSADQLIQWLLDKKLVNSHFDKFLNEQTIDITDLGGDINTILDKLKTTSKEAEETNIFAAEKLEAELRCDWCDHLLENHDQVCNHQFCSCIESKGNLEK